MSSSAASRSVNLVPRQFARTQNRRRVSFPDRQSGHVHRLYESDRLQVRRIKVLDTDRLDPGKGGHDERSRTAHARLVKCTGWLCETIKKLKIGVWLMVYGWSIEYIFSHGVSCGTTVYVYYLKINAGH